MGAPNNLFPRKKQYPLSYRLLVYVLLCSSIFALLSTAVQLYVEYRRDVSNLYKSITFIENSYLEPIAVSVYKIDTEQLKLHMGGALKLPDVVHLVVREQRGDQLIETELGTLTGNNLVQREFVLSYSDAYVQLESIGTLKVTASLDGTYQRLLARVSTVLATNAAKTFLASAGILLIIYWLFTRHLTQISNYIRTVEPDRQNDPLALDRKSSDTSGMDELDLVVTSINSLQDRLKEDISRRKKIEEHLCMAERKYRTVADYTYGWEYWMNGDRELEYVSPSCERISGYSVQEFMDNPQLMEEIVIEEDKELWRTHQCGVEANLENREIQFRIRTKTGMVRWIEHACRPVPPSTGSHAGFRASNRDISARKNAELDARRWFKELAHFNRIALLSELGTTYAHEVNQPLTAIFGNAQVARKLLTKDPLDIAELGEIIDDIINDDKRAVDIIKRIRSLMKPQDLDFRPVDIKKIIQDIASFLRKELLGQKVMLIYDLEDALPRVRGDAIHLQQVLINLVQNGLESMTGCEPDLRQIMIIGHMHDEYKVEISVQDSGPGIPEGGTAQLFESFYTTKKEGMGMGLSICRSIIEAHGGRLWAKNNPEKGATFSFTLHTIAKSGLQ